MINQNNNWTVFLAASILGIIGMLFIFFGVLKNSGIAFLILAAVLALTRFLLGARMDRNNTYILGSTLLGLLVMIFHFLVKNVDTAILFMVVVFSAGFILAVLPGERKKTKTEEIKNIMKEKAAKEEIPPIQIVSSETDKIYKELEKIEEDLKKLEETEKKAKKAITPKKKAVKKKRAKKKKTSSQ